MAHRDKIITSQCDYFLGTDMCTFKNLCLMYPVYGSDNLIVLGIIQGAQEIENGR